MFQSSRLRNLTGLLGVLSALFFLNRAANAQEYARWDLFTGASYAHVDLGPQAALFQQTGQDHVGLHINGSFNPRSYLRILLCDFSVQIGRTALNIAPERGDIRTSQVLFGPEFVHRSSRANFFGHGLVGLTNTRLVATIGGHDVEPDLIRRTNLAFGVGGGVDIRLNRLLFLRGVQVDYIPTRISGSWKGQYRVSGGVIWSFDYRNRR